jgi:hypothetical protein
VRFITEKETIIICFVGKVFCGKSSAAEDGAKALVELLNANDANYIFINARTDAVPII